MPESTSPEPAVAIPAQPRLIIETSSPSVTIVAVPFKSRITPFSLAYSLAISIGTSHGRQKFKPEQCTRNADGVLIPPPLAFDILEEIEKKLPGVPIVLHGSSSVPIEYVKEIEKYGGKLTDSVGIPEEQLRKAAKSAVCKINIDSDGRLAMTAAIRKVFAEHPEEFDPRKYLGPARDELKKLYMHKNKEVLGSAGQA